MSDRMTPGRVFFSVGGASSWLIWLGVIASSLSAVKILNKAFDFGLSGVWNDIVVYYTQLTQPLRDLLMRMPYVETLPSWFPDAFLLYIVLLISGIRATFLPLLNEEYFSSENISGSVEQRYPREEGLDAEQLIDRLSANGTEVVSVVIEESGFVVRILTRERPGMTYAKRLLKCFLLWPVATLEPLRSLRFSISEMAQEWEQTEWGFLLKRHRRTVMAPHKTVEVERLKISGSLQIISLPFMVALFFLLAVYFPGA